jgi:hypothetical protein
MDGLLGIEELPNRAALDRLPPRAPACPFGVLRPYRGASGVLWGAPAPSGTFWGRVSCQPLAEPAARCSCSVGETAAAQHQPDHSKQEASRGGDQERQRDVRCVGWRHVEIKESSQGAFGNPLMEIRMIPKAISPSRRLMSAPGMALRPV